MTESVLTLSLIFIATASSAFTSSSSSSSCPDAIATKLQTCLDQVERDESVLPGGPCSSLDWRCEQYRIVLFYFGFCFDSNPSFFFFLSSFFLF